MQRKIILGLLTATAVLLIGCATDQSGQSATPEEVDYVDGTYRGSFMDRGAIQMSLQFDLEDNIVTEIQYRHIEWAGTNCLEQPYGPQYEQALEYMVGKDVREHLEDLYEPGNFVDDIDGYTGATIRAGKIRSSMQDALNRGMYR